MDSSDSCIAILNVRGSSFTIASARLLTGLSPPRSPDVERGTHVQKLFTRSIFMECLGHRVSIFSNEQLTKKPQRGDLFVGRSEVGRVKQIPY